MEVPLNSYPFVRKEYCINCKYCPFKSFESYCLIASSWNEFNRKYATDDRFEGSFALIRSRVWHLVSRLLGIETFYYFESHSHEYFCLKKISVSVSKFVVWNKSQYIGLESFGLEEVSVFVGKNAISANLIIQMWGSCLGIENNTISLVSMSICLNNVCLKKCWSWIKVLDSV